MTLIPVDRTNDFQLIGRWSTGRKDYTEVSLYQRPQATGGTELYINGQTQIVLELAGACPEVFYGKSRVGSVLRGNLLQFIQAAINTDFLVAAMKLARQTLTAPKIAGPIETAQQRWKAPVQLITGNEL